MLGVFLLVGVGFELLGLGDDTLGDIMSGLLLVFEVVKPLFVRGSVTNCCGGNVVGLFEVCFEVLDALLEVVDSPDQ